MVPFREATNTFAEEMIDRFDDVAARTLVAASDSDMRPMSISKRVVRARARFMLAVGQSTSETNLLQ